MISADAAKKRLALTWFAGAGFLFLIFIVQTLRGRYYNEEKEAWGWLLPNIMPTLLLIVGGLKVGGDSSEESVDLFTYRTALFTSAFYISVVSLTILYSPLAEGERPTLETLQLSNLFVGPLQGIVSGAIGWFFVKQKTG